MAPSNSNTAGPNVRGSADRYVPLPTRQEWAMLSIPTIRVLHVEDDEVQRRLVGHHLAIMSDLAFQIRCVESEDEALEAFADGEIGLVLVDYYLKQGNGGSCLRRLRAIDPIVPIIIISGGATPQMTADLLRLGADNYINKRDLDSRVLGKAVRDALARADSWRHTQADGTDQDSAMDMLARTMRGMFSGNLWQELMRRLDDIEAEARRSRLTVGQIHRLFEEVGRELGADPSGIQAARRLVRPFLLEILLRLFGEIPCSDALRHFGETPPLGEMAG
jgi:DNA-binding response OmpR family regulator